MRKGKRPDEGSAEFRLAHHLTAFVNAAFGRSLRTSRALVEAAQEALEAGYTEDELRTAFWTTAGLQGYWLRTALRDGMIGPEIVLRFKGGTNSQTGKPAKRWLDETIARAHETNPLIVGMTLRRLPAEMLADEKALLGRVKIDYEENA